MKRKFILFRLEGCPYCQRAEQALNEAGIEYETIEVPKSKADRTLLKQISGQNSVPVLIEVIGVQNQDDDILEWLEEQT